MTPRLRPWHGTLTLAVISLAAVQASAAVRPTAEQAETAEAAAAGPKVRILQPTSRKAVAGPTLMVVAARPGAGASLRQVRLFVDGDLVAALSAPPWQAMFDAGQQLRAHTLRAEAEDSEGRIAADLSTTLYVSYIESVEVHAKRLLQYSVQVGVLDRKDRPITGLAAGAFTVRVQGQPVTRLEAGLDPRPLAVGLLLDLSGSTLPLWLQMRQAANLFLAGLAPEDGSEVRLFAGSDIEISPYGHEHVTARSAVLGLEIAGLPRLMDLSGSRLYDSLARAIEAINVRDGQRSIVVFTDTFDTGSLLTHEHLENAIRHAGIRVDVLRFGRRPAGAWNETTRLVKRMRRLAEDSGGREWVIRDGEDLGPTFELLGLQLHHRYRLVFSPTGTERGGEWQKLRVTVTHRGAHLLAPSGYYP